MEYRTRTIENIEFLVLAPAEGLGNVLELLDENGSSFMEINIDEKEDLHLVSYRSEEHVQVSIAELERAIRVARKKLRITNNGFLSGE